MKEKKSTKTDKKETKSKKENKFDHQWYVVNTLSGHERKVARLIEQRIDASELRDQVPEVLVPIRKVVTLKDGQKKTKEEQIIPGYVLVKMHADQKTTYIIRNTEGVTGFIGSSGKPKPVSQEEIESIKKLMSIEKPEIKSTFNIGDAVKISSGTFGDLDFVGTVNSINKQKGKVTVLISMFGRETPKEFDFSEVTKL